MSERQLPLAFPYRPQFREVDFLPNTGNRAALDYLAQPGEWPFSRFALWGEPGAGKTHLLLVWAARAGARVIAGADLRGTQFPSGPVALDDADQVPDEIALLHLMNAAAEQGTAMVLAARRPPARYPVRLPDLASRLRATAAAEVGAADEAFLRVLLARLLAERQMAVSPTVQAWLLLRLPRTAGAVVEAVRRLDRAALAAGSAVTRVLAAETLGDLLAPERAG